MKEIIKEEWNTYSKRKAQKKKKKKEEMNGTVLEGRNVKHIRRNGNKLT